MLEGYWPMESSYFYLGFLVFEMVLQQFSFGIYDSGVKQFGQYQGIFIAVFEFLFKLPNSILQIIDNLKPLLKGILQLLFLLLNHLLFGPVFSSDLCILHKLVESTVLSYNSMITLQLTRHLFGLFEHPLKLRNDLHRYVFFLTNWYSLLAMALSIISCKFSGIKVFTNCTMMIKTIPTFTTNSRLGSLSSFNSGKYKSMLQCCFAISMIWYTLRPWIWGAWIIITSFIFKAYILLYYHRSLSSCRPWCRVWNLSFIEPLVEDSNGLSSKWFCISLSWFFRLLMLPANLVRFLDQFLSFWMHNFY